MNRLKNYVLMAVGFGLLAGVVSVFSVGPAIAQAVRAALVSNVDDPGRIPYQVTGVCDLGNVTACFFANIPPVPAGKRLVITHVAGNVQEEGLPGGTLIRPFIARSGEFGIDFPVAFNGTMGGFSVYVFAQPVLMVYDAGQTPLAGAQLGGIPVIGSYATFVLSGYLLDCTAAPCAAMAP